MKKNKPDQLEHAIRVVRRIGWPIERRYIRAGSHLSYDDLLWQHIRTPVRHDCNKHTIQAIGHQSMPEEVVTSTIYLESAKAGMTLPRSLGTQAADLPSEFVMDPITQFIILPPAVNPTNVAVQKAASRLLVGQSTPSLTKHLRRHNAHTIASTPPSAARRSLEAPTSLPPHHPSTHVTPPSLPHSAPSTHHSVYGVPPQPLDHKIHRAQHA